MDSLMALELSSNLGKKLGLTLSSTLALEYSTVTALTNYLASRVLPEKENQEVLLPSSRTELIFAEEQKNQEQLAETIKQSSEDELAELVDAELDALMSGIWD